MKGSRGVDVTRRQPDSLLELAERFPPASLPDVDPPQIHEGELPRFVAFGLLGLFQPRDRLVELVLLHQVDPDVVVRIAELSIDLDRAQALLRGLREVALEAHGPPQEGMCLCRRIDLDGVAVELDRSIHLSLYLIAVGFPPQFRCSASQSWSVCHCPTSLDVFTRAALNGREASTRSTWSADDPQGSGAEPTLTRGARGQSLERSRPGTGSHPVPGRVGR